MSRVLVFGAQGQLGYQLVQDLEEQGFEVIGLDRLEGDLTSKGAISRAFVKHQPSLVFNAAAYNAVDQAEQEQDQAIAINGVGPGLIAAACREHEATMVHFSTDYVFGHGHEQPIDETREPAPLGAYGRSKLLGERLVLANCPRSFVLRCCGLYGERRHNFVRTMIRAAIAGRTLNVVQDQLVSPTWVLPLSRVAIALSKTKLHGVYHATAHGGISWYDYAAQIFDRLEIKAELHPTSQATWGAKAPRPPYSVLDNAMLRLLGLDSFEDCSSALDKFLSLHGQAIVAQERERLKA